MRILKTADTSSFVGELSKSKRFRIYGILGLLFALFALFMMWLRRKKDPDFPQDFTTGYTLSLLDVTSSMRSGETDQEYLGWKGNILAAVWMMFGLGIVACHVNDDDRDDNRTAGQGRHL